MTHIMSLATALGKDEVKQHYYFLKLFPFSLGGAPRDWYKSLALGSITSKGECYIVFFSKLIPADKSLAMMAEVSKFTQKEGENLPQAWGRFNITQRRCSFLRIA
jgi:hypothetical protein